MCTPEIIFSSYLTPIHCVITNGHRDPLISCLYQNVTSTSLNAVSNSNCLVFIKHMIFHVISFYLLIKFGSYITQIDLLKKAG